MLVCELPTHFPFRPILTQVQHGSPDAQHPLQADLPSLGSSKHSSDKCQRRLVVLNQEYWHIVNLQHSYMHPFHDVPPRSEFGIEHRTTERNEKQYRCSLSTTW